MAQKRSPSAKIRCTSFHRKHSVSMADISILWPLFQTLYRKRRKKALKQAFLQGIERQRSFSLPGSNPGPLSSSRLKKCHRALLHLAEEVPSRFIAAG
jgi:hypothetical protein